MNQRRSQGMVRRQFLRRAGCGVALFNILPGVRVGGAEGLPVGDRLNLAGIGIGSRGGAVIDEAAGLGHNVVALCDVDENYAGKQLAKYPKARRFTDYRVMLDKMGTEVDGVVIGTPDHTHAVIAMEAMRRGRHVYCEKPLAHSVGEVRRLMAAAQEHKVVTQLGNQGHSSNSIRRVCEWIWAGAIGKVHTVHAGCDAFPQVYCQIPNLPKVQERPPVPEGLDYELWLGPAQFRPYSPLWVHWNWRGWLPYGGGAVGDWICHVVDPAFWALDLGSPSSLRAEVVDYDIATQGLTYPPGTRITYEFPAKADRGPVQLVWHDGKTRIPRPPGLAAEYPIPGTGAVIQGDQGMIVHGSHGGGNCVLLPESLMEQYSGSQAPAEKIPRVRGHVWDWAEAIRTSRPAGSHFGYGGPLTELGLLGLIALRFPGEKLLWDGDALQFKNSATATALVTPPYRSGWTL